MDVPSRYCVIDDRKPSEMKGVTISNYKRTEVAKAFHNSIMDGNLERACLWTAELHCSGKVDLIWKELLDNSPGYLNKANPHIAGWLWYKFDVYNFLLRNLTPKYRYEHRNNQEIRNLLIDLVSVVTISNKNDLSKIVPKVGKKELVVMNYRKKIQSSHMRFIENIVNRHDPSEIQIGINEVVNQFGLIGFKIEDVMYWYLWLDLLQKSKKEWEPFICFPHDDPAKNPDVDPRLHGDWVWAFWRAILDESEQRDTATQDAINALYQIYQWKFTKTAKNRKKDVIFAACALLCDDVKWNTKMIQNVKLRIQACSNSNILYKLIDEKLDPYRSVSRSEYYSYVQPLVAKVPKKRNKNKTKVKEEIKKENKQSFNTIKSDFFSDFLPQAFNKSFTKIPIGSKNIPNEDLLRKGSQNTTKIPNESINGSVNGRVNESSTYDTLVLAEQEFKIIKLN